MKVKQMLMLSYVKYATNAKQMECDSHVYNTASIK